MTSTDSVLLRNVEVHGRVVDVRASAGRIDAIGPSLTTAGASAVVDGHGGALVPGLHDHHLHLFAVAAAASSAQVGPPAVRDVRDLASALRAADAALPAGRWLRATGYHESVAGDLDRHGLDRIVGGRPVRVQHRSGARWIFNSAALAALDLTMQDHPGIERDARGTATGRVHRADSWLRTLLPAAAMPDLASVGAALASRGVTGVTDTTASDSEDDLRALAGAVATGALPQRVMVTGGHALAGTATPEGVERGPVKLIVDDGDYPALHALADHIVDAHGHDRPVAVHCVTRPALVLALAAWDVAGSRPGDRVEHGAVVPTELIPDLRRHGLTVVTQPGFVAERGDDYTRDVDEDDLPHLYRCRSLLDAGVRVAGSTDAPYTAPDPWAAMRAAVTRRAPSGAVLGADERVTAEVALGLFLGDLHDPGGPARVVQVGGPADLCLLARPLAAALERLDADDVLATLCGGRLVYRRDL